MTDKPKWADQIKRQSEQFRNFPQIQAFERAVTTCIEIVMAEINIKLATHPEEVAAIDAVDALLLSDPKTGRPTQLGLYTTIQFLVGEAILSQATINGKKLTLDTIDKLGTIMRVFTPEQHNEAIERFFYKHSQLEKISDLNTPQKLFELIDAIVTEETNSWLLGKPSRLNPKPQGPQLT